MDTSDSEYIRAINESWKTKDPKLSLQNTNLTKLPGELKELTWVTFLDTSINEIEVIENLPPNIEKLHMMANPVTKVDLSQYNKLTEVNLRNNNVTDLISAPPNLISIDLSHNNIKTISEDFFTKLKNLYKVEIHNNENLPPDVKFGSVKVLDVARCNLKKFSIPYYCEEIDISTNSLESLEIKYPLKIVTAFYSGIQRINGFISTGIEELDLCGNNLTLLPDISACNKLKKLDLSNNNFAVLPNICFDSLDELNISGNEFPKDKEVLTSEQIKKLSKYDGPGDDEESSFEIDSDGSDDFPFGKHTGAYTYPKKFQSAYSVPSMYNRYSYDPYQDPYKIVFEENPITL